MIVKYVGGSYPNLCSGELTVELEDGTVHVGEIASGGTVYFDEEWNAEVTEGPWTVYMDSSFPSDRVDEVTEWVNENVQQGCCGGCV